jgi:hypothetical protein
VSHALGKDTSLIFRCGYNEAFNLQIGPFSPECPSSQTEDEFRRYAQSKRYTSLEFGRFIVEGTVHVWARYYMGNGAWSKKYMIILSETEYVITATCFNQAELAKKEQIWDEIVSSFRLPGIESGNIDDLEVQAYMFFEIGYSYFRSGRYREALEQYEKGKLLTKKSPGNYFGVSMTIMQMIEVKAIPKDQISFYLEKAGKNIDECLRIAPMRQDYLQAKNIIRDYKKKYQV